MLYLHSLHSLLHGVEHWQVEVHGASLASSYSSHLQGLAYKLVDTDTSKIIFFCIHHVCAIFDSLLRVECSLLACESLKQEDTG